MDHQELTGKVAGLIRNNRATANETGAVLARVPEQYRKDFSDRKGLYTVSPRFWGKPVHGKPSEGTMDVELRAELLAEFIADHTDLLENSGCFEGDKRLHRHIVTWVREFIADPKPAPEPTPEPAPQWQSEPVPEPVPEVEIAVADSPLGRPNAPDLSAVHTALGIQDAVDAAVAKAREETLAYVLANAKVTRVEVVERGEVVRSLDGPRHKAYEDMADMVQAGLHVFAAGPTGSGKSHLIAIDMAKTLGIKPENVCVISASRGMSPSVFFGWLLPLGDDGRFDHFAGRFMHCCETEEPSLVFIDEMCNTPAEVLTGLNSLFGSEREMEVPQRLGRPTMRLAKNSYVFAADNTFGRGGDRSYVRQKLDASTLGRFSQILIDYDVDLERERFGSDMPWLQACWDLRAKAADLNEPVCPRKMAEGAALRAVNGDKYTVERCLDRITTGWSEKAREKCGIVRHLL